MKHTPTLVIAILLGALLLAGCSKTENEEKFSDEELAQTAYLEFLSGDRTLLNVTQSELWWIPDFQDPVMKYEYTCLDLDGDNIDELLVQLVDDPCGYNGVFHFENGQIFCWNSDAMEMSCRDYPLQDGTMVRQYDYAGTRSYDIFCYQSSGEIKSISQLFVREELIPEDSTEPCPYYEIDGKEIDKEDFDKKFALLVTDQLVERTVWMALSPLAKSEQVPYGSLALIASSLKKVL